MQQHDLWAALPSVPWDTLSRIHGNCHSSMIGLITSWWVGLCPDHWALDGPPGYRSRRVADALLCDASGPVGVLEVEGTAYPGKADTIGHYLTPEDHHVALDGIRFGILVLYPVTVTRRDGETDLLSGGVPGVQECLERAGEITGRLTDTEIIVVAVDKRYEADVHPVRRISDLGYHRCRVSRVRAVGFVGGNEVCAPEILWREP